MYLLDTHVIYWSLRESDRLPERVKHIMEEEDCCISIASLWEMSIKSSLGKLEMNKNCQQIADVFEKSGIPVLVITPEDCDQLHELPFIHKDPFDRILIAQAISNHCVIVTKDHIIPKYNIATVWD